MSCCRLHLEHWNSRSRFCFLIFCLPVILTVVSRPVAARPRLRHRSSGASQWRVAAASGAEWAIDWLSPDCTECWAVLRPLHWLPLLCTDCLMRRARPWRDHPRAGQHRDLHHAAGRSPLLSRVIIYSSTHYSLAQSALTPIPLKRLRATNSSRLSGVFALCVSKHAKRNFSTIF